VYPDPRVEALIRDNFIPVRVHVKDPNAAAIMQRFGANWTPTIVLLDSGGVERHRIEGFLPTEDFMAQLTLGLGKVAFAQGEWKEAESRFSEVLQKYPSSDSAPEALYWQGVTRYKATGDPEALKETTRAFRERYTDSPWAKKGSVWV
jgi:tetratricopeptide (TPR) repeat protein